MSRLALCSILWKITNNSNGQQYYRVLQSFIRGAAFSGVFNTGYSCACSGFHVLQCYPKLWLGLQQSITYENVYSVLQLSRNYSIHTRVSVPWWEVGPPPRKQVCPPQGSKSLRGRGWGDPIPTKVQKLWRSMFTIIPLRLQLSSIIQPL